MRCITICLFFVLTSWPAWGQSLTPEQREVWAGEEAYWEYVGRQDVEAFMSLWHERFIGWPCDAPTTVKYPGLRAAVEDWFAEVTVKGNKTQIASNGVIVDKDFAITYVAVTTTGTDASGVEKCVSEKIVHTWRRTGDGWKIIGGMCGPLKRPNK